MKELAEDWTEKGLCPITGFHVGRKRVDHKAEYERRKARKNTRKAPK